MGDHCKGGGGKVFLLHSRTCEPHLFSHLRTNISYFPACVRISFLYYVSYLKLGEILPCPEANIFHKTSDPSPTQHGDSKVLAHSKTIGVKNQSLLLYTKFSKLPSQNQCKIGSCSVFWENWLRNRHIRTMNTDIHLTDCASWFNHNLTTSAIWT